MINIKKIKSTSPVLPNEVGFVSGSSGGKTDGALWLVRITYTTICTCDQ